VEGPVQRAADPAKAEEPVRHGGPDDEGDTRAGHHLEPVRRELRGAGDEEEAEAVLAELVHGEGQPVRTQSPPRRRRTFSDAGRRLARPPRNDPLCQPTPRVLPGRLAEIAAMYPQPSAVFFVRSPLGARHKAYRCSPSLQPANGRR